MSEALVASRVFDGARIRRNVAVIVEDGRIRATTDAREIPSGTRRRMLGDGVLAPGFVDLQVNGGGGVLFNDEPTADGAAAIATAHRRYGTTGCLPTLITDRDEVLDRAVAGVAAAIGRGASGVLGIHLEGPFLNPDRKGVHDPRFMRAIEERDFARLAALGRLGPTLVTLAPERHPAGTVMRLTDAGAKVSAGHTTASFDQILSALDEGLSGYTHLFNAMTPLGSREPGVVGAALADRRGHFGIIADGIHVHPASLKSAVAAGGVDRAVLVTDAMPPVGGADPTFSLYGERIEARDGRCVTAEGTLAGSALDMATAVRNAVRLLGLPVGQALAMASLNPARWIGLDHRIGRIAPGYRADFVFLNPALDVMETWIRGVDSGG